MEVALGSRMNVSKMLEMLESIETTRFQDLPETWRYRTPRSVYCNPVLTGRGSDFVYYDPWRRQKIEEETASSSAVTTRVVPDNLSCGFTHVDEDVDRTPRDTSHDYVPYAYGATSHYQGSYYASPSSAGGTENDGVEQPAVMTQSNEETPKSGGAEDTTAERRFIEDAGVIPSGK